jgi:hypothetical protein
VIFVRARAGRLDRARDRTFPRIERSAYKGGSLGCTAMPTDTLYESNFALWTGRQAQALRELAEEA